MADLILKGGLLVDGTGGPSRRADILISGGRIDEICEPGALLDSNTKTVDVLGRVVAPGFIDLHTHLDAQVFWDPACTPIPFHGVTTVIGGNCGFSIAPLGTGPDDADYMIRMLASVEEIPIASLRVGVPWNWRTTAEYLDRVEEARPAINMGFMAGHSALRRAIMGAKAVGGKASRQQIGEMAALLRQSLGAGALGFSSSLVTHHTDGEGKTVPSYSASDDELLALAAVVGEFPGTELELIGVRNAAGHASRDADLMIAMSLSAHRKLNWNVFMPDESDTTKALLALSDTAAREGASVYALGFPGLMMGVTRFPYAGFPGWDDFDSLSDDERLALLMDPTERSRLGVLAASLERTDLRRGRSALEEMYVHEAFTDETSPLVGHKLAEIASKRDRSTWDVLCDILVADGMRTRFYRALVSDSKEAWEARKASWSDPRVILGGSDAGAHVNTIATWNWATDFLALNREHRVMSLEAAVHRVTGRQADLYGIVGRGRIAEGYFADVTVFDPDLIAPGPVHTVADFPSGASRLTSPACGISHVFVNGTEIVRDGNLTGHQPGRVLRSGHDTVTVPLTSFVA